MVSGETRASPWRGRRLQAVAAALIFAGGIAAGYALGLSGWQPASGGTGAIAERAIEAHVIYAAEKLHVVEVGADQKDHLVGWLSKRVGLTLIAPDLGAHGYALVGGRLLPSGSQKAAQFMYEDASGGRISIYVTAEAGSQETGFRLFQIDGARAFYWLDGGFGYAVAGAVPEDVLLAVANSVYRQLLEGSVS